jgi:hypothetical protein
MSNSRPQIPIALEVERTLRCYTLDVQKFIFHNFKIFNSSLFQLICANDEMGLCQEWTYTSKHYVKSSWSNLWYSICYGLLKLYKNTYSIKNKLNGLNTFWYIVLYE